VLQKGVGEIEFMEFRARKFGSLKLCTKIFPSRSHSRSADAERLWDDGHRPVLNSGPP
jgi:hypothetical protein